MPVLALALLPLLAACGTDDGGAGASIDASTADGSGTAADVGLPDAQPDTDAPDTVDAGPDITDVVAVDVDDTETGSEADVIDDTIADTNGPDALVDAQTDTTDVVTDASTDATTDATTDASPDGGSDAGADSGTDPDPLPPEGLCGLLINTDAESGNLDGWTVSEGNFLTVEGSFFGQRPDAYEGSRSFAAGNSARSEMYQRADVTEWAEEISEGMVNVRLSARVRTWSGDDEPYLIIRAFDADESLLETATAGPWGSETWTERTVGMMLPPRTATVEAALRGVRRNGNDNDAYFDAIDLCVGGGTPGPALTAPPYLMWVTEDAISVRWETADSMTGTFTVTTPDGPVEWTESSAGRTHEIRVDGLQPATEYSYRLTWDGGSGPAYRFRTAPGPGSDDPFSFLVWGDNQNGPENFAAMTPTMAGLNADFAMSSGDCVQNGTRGEYRSQLFAPIAPLARQTPFLIAAGNHERYSDSGAALFEEYMSQPGDEHCFGWTYGSLYMVFIDTELSINPGSAQDACIRAALSSEEALAATFRGAIFHKPPRIEYWFGGVIAFPDSMEAPQVRETLEPLLESLDVDVVFNGHNHLYAYTPETPGGITWFTTGGGGGMIDTASALWRVGDWPQIAVQIHRFHFLHVEVDGNEMTVRAVSSTGETLHTATVTAD